MDFLNKILPIVDTLILAEPRIELKEKNDSLVLQAPLNTYIAMLSAVILGTLWDICRFRYFNLSARKDAFMSLKANLMCHFPSKSSGIKVFSLGKYSIYLGLVLC